MNETTNVPLNKSGRLRTLHGSLRRYSTAPAAGIGQAAAVESAPRSPAPLHFPRPRLTIGVCPTTNTRLLEQAVSRLRARCPELRVHCANDTSEALLHHLRSGAVDVVLTREPSVRQLGGLHFEALYEEALAFVCHPRHPLAFRYLVYPTDLTPYPIDVLTDDVLLISEAQRYLSTQGLAAANVVKQAVDVTDYLSGRGNRILITSQGTSASSVAHRDVVRLPLDRRVPHYQVGLTHRHDCATRLWITQLASILRGLTGP